MTVDKSGRVWRWSPGGGSVASLPIGEDGELAQPLRQSSTPARAWTQADRNRHTPHSINPSPDNAFAVAADLGLDKVLVYKLDPSAGTLTANKPPSASTTPGEGPRHFAFHPSGKYAYVINEMDCTVTAFDYDAKRGVLMPKQTVSNLPGDEKVKEGYSTAEVQVHPSGKFVYGSNRGHDTISVFAVNEKDGTLKQIQNVSTEGSTPRPGSASIRPASICWPAIRPRTRSRYSRSMRRRGN